MTFSMSSAGQTIQ